MRIRPCSVGLYAFASLSQPPLLTIGRVLREKVVYSLAQNEEYHLLFGNQRVASTQLNPMLLTSLFSRVIGSNLHKSIYLKQTVDQIGDVSAGDSIDCVVTICEELGGNRYRLDTQGFVDNVLVISGNAWILQE